MRMMLTVAMVLVACGEEGIPDDADDCLTWTGLDYVEAEPEQTCVLSLTGIDYSKVVGEPEDSMIAMGFNCGNPDMPNCNTSVRIQQREGDGNFHTPAGTWESRPGELGVAVVVGDDANFDDLEPTKACAWVQCDLVIPE